MTIEESLSESESDDVPPQPFLLGQEVFDRAGKKLGKVQARFSRYILVERGSIFVKAYYVPHSLIARRTATTLQLTLSENDLRAKGLDSVPEDLFVEHADLERPDITGVGQFVQRARPLSPAETGHYHYGRYWPGMNTDASGSYRREEVTPQPQRSRGETIFTTDWPLPPREISPD